MDKRKRRYRFLSLITIIVFSLSIFGVGYGQENGSQDTASRNARILLTRLSAEEKVGQLFLVTMDGAEIDEDSPIRNLIQNYHLGGVILKRSNNNFTSSEDAVEKTHALIKDLQQLEWQNANLMIESDEVPSINDYVPLFIGISQSGDLYPDDQLLSGLTPLPSQMSIGASWDPDISEQIGALLGKELAGLGFNLILNPSLDVLESPSVESKGDIGVGTFGGDPFWVGEMSKAYIKGLHNGSIGKIAVIARNFPGRGGSDRPADEEVATVRKSLEQLKLIELAPFFEVTDLSKTSGTSIVEGLLLSHIRYQGFQGNIRATTKPVSFDKTAVDLLLSLNPFSEWRANGGILVSEDLGSTAIKKFFNPGDQNFDARQIVRNAFLAGNDLLYLDQLKSSGDNTRFDTYKKTIELFIQKYREDKAFADRVDASVLRILTLKFKLYPEFQIERISPSAGNIINIGNGEQIVYQVPGKAATLISPKVDQLPSALPDEPIRTDTLVIFTDTLAVMQCDACELNDIVSVNELQNVIVKLYGKNGSGQIQDQNILSYSFIELEDYVNNPFNRVELETNLSRADWVIFAIHSQSPNKEGSNALHNLLAKKPEVLRNKNVVVFSFNAPYYYDATEISAFTAYYCLYTKIPAAFETAAKLLFKEVSPMGNSPVTISGIAYNLIDATMPKSDQIIELYVEEPIIAKEINQNTAAEENGFSGFKLGDNLPIKTGEIRDQNNHLVPDGTVVRFMLSEEGENLTIQQIEATTKHGIARASFILQVPGRKEIRASAEPAMNSQILLIDISEGTDAIISSITPTPYPTMEIEDSVSLANNLPQIESTVIRNENNRFVEWLVFSIFSWASGYFFFCYAGFIKSKHARIQVSLAGVAGGLVLLLWMMMGLPGSFPRYGFSGYALLGTLIILAQGSTGFTMWLIQSKGNADKFN